MYIQQMFSVSVRTIIGAERQVVSTNAVNSPKDIGQVVLHGENFLNKLPLPTKIVLANNDND